MQVAVELRPDVWGGTGVFAAEDIPAGKLVWSLPEADVDVLALDQSRELFESLGASEKANLAKFCYFQADGQMVDIRRDSGRFFNHSFTPNSSSGSHIGGGLDPESTYAVRNIAAGEEIFEDYTTYGAAPDWFPVDFDPSRLVEVRLIKSRGACRLPADPSPAEKKRLFEDGSAYDFVKGAQMVQTTPHPHHPEYTCFRVGAWGEHKWRMTPCEGILMWKTRGEIFIARSPVKYETVSFGGPCPAHELAGGERMHLVGLSQNVVPPEFYDLPEKRWLQVGQRGDQHIWMLRLYRREPNSPDIDCDPATGQGYTYYVKRAVYMHKKTSD